MVGGTCSVYRANEADMRYPGSRCVPVCFAFVVMPVYRERRYWALPQMASFEYANVVLFLPNGLWIVIRI